MKIIDDLDRSCVLPNYPPKKIISLVPSITELLYNLGLEDSIAGITKFCVYPEVIYRSKPRIGGTKTIDIEKITSIAPDLIIANKEENNREEVEILSARFPTYVTDIRNYEDALEKIKIIGELTDKKQNAQALLDVIAGSFERLRPHTVNPKVAYLIWKSPLMVAGGDTYIQDMLSRAGFENAFAHYDRYPTIEIGELLATKIDYILLSSEPFPFMEKDIAHFQRLLPHTKATLVDGTMFSWYGSRLRLVPSYFVKLRTRLKE